MLHRGWWLVTSVYLVVDARLSAAQLILIGVAQGLISLLFEVPAGVVADTLSRKWSLVVSHALMGLAMLATGLVTDFWTLVATQLLWGLSWTFASGADVAWISDESDEPARVPGVLIRAGRAQMTGAVAGMLGIGALAWLTTRGAAMVLSGAAMLVLGLYVVVRFRERRFVPADARRWATSWSILVRGVALVRRSRVVLVMVAAAFLVNGVTGVFGRVFQVRLVDIGLTGDPVVWVTVIGVLSYLGGALALRLARPHAPGVRRGYLLACLVGAAGIVGLAVAPEEVSGSAAVVVATAALPVTRTFGTIWVNRETTGDVRATVHSLLAQAEYLGGVGCGAAVALVARLAGLPAALVAGAALVAVAIVLVQGLPVQGPPVQGLSGEPSAEPPGRPSPGPSRRSRRRRRPTRRRGGGSTR